VKLLEILSAVLESSDKISKLKKDNSESVSFDFDEVHLSVYKKRVAHSYLEAVHPFA